tara:strand:- start:119 stop:379 length:261 start_codon:yes stop_codon:yes gene_type:complete
LQCAPSPSFWVYDQNPAHHQQPYVVKLVYLLAMPCLFSLRTARHIDVASRIAHPSLSVHDQDRHSPSAAVRGEADENQSVVAQDNP